MLNRDIQCLTQSYDINDSSGYFEVAISYFPLLIMTSNKNLSRSSSTEDRWLSYGTEVEKVETTEMEA